MINTTTIIKNKLTQTLTIVFLIIFMSQVLIGTVYLHSDLINQTRIYLENSTKRVNEDLIYNNGKWDMSRYNADPKLPDTYPLYILASDGFVLERWKPVDGFLDLSDFKHLSAFDKPQTIKTPTDQDWRIYSKPILDNKETLAITTVSYFNPSMEELQDVDQNLIQYAELINSQIKIQNGTLDTSSVDPREINFKYSFQVVDEFNKIIAKNNNNNSIDRIPNFIDSSYVGDQLNQIGLREIKDQKSDEKFLILTTPLTDKNNTTLGVIVIGKSISFINSAIRNFLIVQIISAIILTISTTALISWILTFNLSKLIRKGRVVKETINAISFDKTNSMIIADDMEIDIPYNTNQYFFCDALFSSPKKKWETDEILERFGDTSNENWRKVYDTMITINKKVSQIANVKLFIKKGRRYQINPELIQKIM